MRRIAGLGFGLLMLACSLWLAAGLILHWGILPHINEWRGPLQARAGRALGVPVRIGHIAVRGAFWSPVFELHDVALLDAAGRPVLRLPRVSAALSAHSLIALEVRLRQLAIEGAELEVRRDADGHLHVAGLDFGGPGSGEGPDAAAWFFRQREFVLRGGALRFVDEQRRAAPIVFTDVQLVVRNGLYRHALRLDATLPAGWGGRVTAVGRFRQPLLGPAGWPHWSGQAFVDLPHADLGAWRDASLPPPRSSADGANGAGAGDVTGIATARGDGALRGWFDIAAGMPTAFTVDVALRGVSVQLGGDAERLEFERLEGRVVVERDRADLRVALQRFGFSTRDGVQWPAGDMRLTLRGATAEPGAPAGLGEPAAPDALKAPDASNGSNGSNAPNAPNAPNARSVAALPSAPSAPFMRLPSHGGEFSATRLDLALAARIAAGLPLGAPAHRLLAQWRPQGAARNVQVTWDGAPDAPRRFHASGAVAGAGMQSQAADDPQQIGRPGVQNLDVEFDATERGGSASVAMAHGALDLPGVFEAPWLPLDRLAARLEWSVDAAADASANASIPSANASATAANNASAAVAANASATGPAPGAPEPKLAITIRNARFANADIEGEVTATWRTGPGHGFGRDGRYPGRLELDATLARARAASVPRYLPLGMPLGSRRYLERAVQGGEVRDARIHVDGRLRDFPFSGARRDDGEFRVGARLEGVGFAYVPERSAGAGFAEQSGQRSADAPRWPPASNLEGDLVIDRTRLELRHARGRLAGAEWRRIDATIPDLDAPELALDAAGRGPLAEMLGFVNASPLAVATGQTLARASAGGPAELTLGLAIPLERPEAARVDGHLELAGNDVRMAPDSPLLGAAHGRVDFTAKGFSIVGAGAEVLGGAVRFEGGSQPDGSVRFHGEGVASAEALRQAVELGDVVRLAGELSGRAGYRIALGWLRGRSEISVASDLVGIASHLPAPLDKAADTPLALRYETVLAPAAGALPERPAAAVRVAAGGFTDRFAAGDPADRHAASGLAGRPGAVDSIPQPVPDGPTPATADTLRLRLGERLQAEFRRDLSGTAPRVLRGGIGVMAEAPQPAAGVAANLVLPAVDLDAWEAVADRLAGAASAERASTDAVAGSAAYAGGAAAAVHAAAAAARPPADGPAAGAYVPDTIAVRAEALNMHARRLDHVVAGASQRGGVWRANVDADQIAGYLEYHPPGGDAPESAIYARLARLALPKSEADPVEGRRGEAPVRLPALDIAVDDFELHGKRLGRLEVEAVNRPAASMGKDRAAPREWVLSKFELATPEARLTGSGSWAASDGSRGAGEIAGKTGTGSTRESALRRSVLNFQLAVDDSGALLGQLGMPHVVRGGKGALHGQLAWLGSPFDLDYPSLAGRVHVAIDAGQFLKAGSGAARLLGVLSLQALPRRFMLDFRDLFQAGFAFDNVTGDLNIERGEAETHNLRMRGVQAVVLLDGRANIEQETQDVHVWVVPELNAGTASLAYAVINPAIGLGTFLAQLALRQPLLRAGTREFHVHGPWDDPQVDTVERKFSDAVPPTDLPAAQAGTEADVPADAPTDAPPGASVEAPVGVPAGAPSAAAAASTPAR